MCQVIFFIMCSLLGCAYSDSTFDQRQTGDFNVQVDLKDLHIIALMKGSKEEYVDYDYAYDYSEMTIKPQNGTTPKPLNTTSTASDPEKNNITLSIGIVEQTTLTSKDNTSQLMDTASTGYPVVYDTFPIAANGTAAADFTTANPKPSGLSVNIRNETSFGSPANSTTCKKGFVLSQKGDCEIKQQGTGNALLKLVKLSQKLKLRRENRRGTSSRNSA